MDLAATVLTAYLLLQQSCLVYCDAVSSVKNTVRH
jgi:hypothetical protein